MKSKSNWIFALFYKIEKGIYKIYNKSKEILNSKNIFYYREKIKEITPAEMQFLHSKTINFENAFLQGFIIGAKRIY